ncbi:CIC11C00000000711 [Sungouiella intermedia]|uniref:Translation initiation factor eIF2B subunit gamma n=1 Tax=Sungouiella intermedia TaxID=45354 RepID=A0A1L0GJB3_9ASCO|nr:CIC11C00000000711 [[Candida] intermedia]
MEFHTFVLCGPGKQLAPFSKERSTGIAKALLPVANRPMVEYVLDWCEKAFFPKVTLVCDPESQDDIQKALDAYKSRKISELAGNSSDLDDNTVQFAESIDVISLPAPTNGLVLQHVVKKALLKPYQHFALLPCDFITDLPPQVLIEAYRSRQDSDVGLAVSYRNQLEIEDKKHRIFPKNFTVFTDLPNGDAQMLDYYSAEDVEFHKAFKIRTQMVWNYPNSTVSLTLLNSSIFLGDGKRIAEILDDNQHKFTDAYFNNRPLIKVIRDLARKPWQSVSHDSTVGFLVVPEVASFVRSNNLPVLLEANRQYLKLQARDNAGKPAAPKDKTAANVGADALVGDGTVLGEKTNVKRSVVGRNCVIGKRVKLTGSIILDNVVIEDDAQLENCIIGQKAIIRSKCKLTNCYVESTNEVVKGTQSKGDTLLCLTLEGLVESESAVESTSSLEGSSDDDYDEYEYDDEEYGDNSDGLFGY